MDQLPFFQDHPWIKKHLFSLILGFLGLILIGYGLMQYLAPHQSREKVAFDDKIEATQPPVKSQKKIMIDIEGAVIKAGVYQLTDDARIQDVLSASGGLSADADKDYVQKHINLAAKVSDGTKVYIPKKGETISGNANVLGASSDQSSSSDMISINNASPKDLDSLPGIGAVTAEKIINGRPYNDINELLTKKIVSSKVFGQIKEKISL